jgi:hypothetical protein
MGNQATWQARRESQSVLGTPVVVFEALDVILSQITSCLYLDELQRDLARVLEAVLRAPGDVRALIFSQEENLFCCGDARSSLHDNPVFRPMVVDV